MNNERTNLIKLVSGTLAFSLLFILACVSILVFLPSGQSKKIGGEEVSENTVIPEEGDLFALLDYEIEPIELTSLDEDSGLSLYRQNQSRPAVEWFYTRVTNNREVALAILTSADKFDIPVSLAFALAYAESGFQVTASHVNANGSIDRGLFQLNSATFTKLSESDFYNPNTSAYYGMNHLRFCLNSAGNEIAALAMYNAGSSKVKRNNTPQTTLNYISKIQNYRGMLEQNFASEVLAFFDANGNDYRILAKY